MKFFVYYLQALLAIEQRPSDDVYRYLSKVLSVTTNQIDGAIPQNLKYKQFDLDTKTLPKRVYVTYTISDCGIDVGIVHIHSISLTGIGYVDQKYVTESFELNENMFDIRLK